MDLVRILGRSTSGHLCRLSNLLAQAGAPFAVIGASALLLHRMPLPRTTRDLDLGVAVSGGLDAVRPILLQAGLHTTSIEHRFRCADRTEIDVLAVDPRTERPYEIQLGEGDRIRTLGLHEAIKYAEPQEVGTCRVFVPSLALLIAMKLSTAADASRPHDLGDAHVALTNYGIGDERRFAIEYERFGGLTYDTSGAFLAGIDACRLLEGRTMPLILREIAVLMEDVRLSSRFADGLERRSVLQAFRQGLSSATEEPAANPP